MSMTLFLLAVILILIVFLAAVNNMINSAITETVEATVVLTLNKVVVVERGPEDCSEEERG